jgi:hypothetical protein
MIQNKTCSNRFLRAILHRFQYLEFTLTAPNMFCFAQQKKTDTSIIFSCPSLLVERRKKSNRTNPQHGLITTHMSAKPPTNRAVWDSAKLCGCVQQPKGKVLETLGGRVGNCAILQVEELVFLLQLGHLELSVDGDVMSNADAQAFLWQFAPATLIRTYLDLKRNSVLAYRSRLCSISACTFPVVPMSDGVPLSFPLVADWAHASAGSLSTALRVVPFASWGSLTNQRGGITKDDDPLTEFAGLFDVYTARRKGFSLSHRTEPDYVLGLIQCALFGFRSTYFSPSFFFFCFCQYRSDHQFPSAQALDSIFARLGSCGWRCPVRVGCVRGGELISFDLSARRMACLPPSVR